MKYLQEGSVSAGIYSESEESGTESEELTEDDEAYEDDEDDYTTEDSDADADADDDIEHASNASETSIEFHGTKENNKVSFCIFESESLSLLVMLGGDRWRGRREWFTVLQVYISSFNMYVLGSDNHLDFECF